MRRAGRTLELSTRGGTCEFTVLFAHTTYRLVTQALESSIAHHSSQVVQHRRVKQRLVFRGPVRVNEFEQGFC